MEKARDDPSMASEESQEQEWRLFSKRKGDKKKVHFAAQMNICHLKNAELEPQLQKS